MITEAILLEQHQQEVPEDEVKQQTMEEMKEEMEMLGMFCLFHTLIHSLTEICSMAIRIEIVLENIFFLINS